MNLDDIDISDCVAPHCDPLVLHPASDCIYCAKFPNLQQQRIDMGINFTGETDPNKSPDPASLRRPAETINMWPGNRPEGY